MSSVPRLLRTKHGAEPRTLSVFANAQLPAPCLDSPMSSFGASSTTEAAHAAFRKAEQLHQRGAFEQALPINRELVKKYPKWPFGYFGLANSYAGMGRFEDARKNLRKAIALQGDSAVFHAKLAEVHNRLGDREQALLAIDKAIELDPANHTYIVNKAMIFRYNNDPHTAFKLLTPLIEKGSKDEHLVRIYAALSGVLDMPAKGVEALLPLTKTVNHDPMVTASHLYVLAGLYNKLGQYEKAYDAAQRGAQLRDDHYHPQQRDQLFKARAKAWSPQRMPTLARSRITSDKPVFIVGMPRSGTTLIEQIIAAHPQAYGGGELINIFAAAEEIAATSKEQPDLSKVVEDLKPATLDRVARRILREMEKQVPRGEHPSRITDKLPLNIQHLGLIEQLFPGARVIHCRRHPLDVFISCYLLDFEGVNAHAYTYSPEHFAHFYALYEKYMTHWHEACTIPIMDIQYEQVVDDQRAQTQRLLEFLGLPWDDACLGFHKQQRTVTTASTDQVRKEIYTSSRHRFKNFESRLGPIRKAFEAHGVQIPDEG